MPRAAATLTALPLFPELDCLLLELLRSLRPADWDQPTVAGKWRVRDVARHLVARNSRLAEAWPSGARRGAQQLGK